jgi:membrane fusion protein (multidrug efflux system)
MGGMMSILMKVLMAIVAVVISAGVSYAQEEGQAKGPPPALVVVSEITLGSAEPVADFVGTVYYSKVSDVASEVEGQVEVVRFEEGYRVKEGQELVLLSTDLLDATIRSTRASYEQVLAQLEKARKDFKRIEAIYKEESIAETVYDENLFRVKELDSKAASMEAELERLELERQKKAIKSPFNGLVITKSVEKGEWVSGGSTVAVVARDSEVDIIVDVPEGILRYMKPGRMVRIRAAGRLLEGAYLTFIPKGDVATRTFSVKIRMDNKAALVEGMEAVAELPQGEKTTGLVVPRDAVVSQFGMTVIFLAENNVARMVPVEVTGYEGLKAGVKSKGPPLSEGMAVVVKGQERLRDGQQITIIKGSGIEGSGH